MNLSTFLRAKLLDKQCWYKFGIITLDTNGPLLYKMFDIFWHLVTLFPCANFAAGTDSLVAPHQRFGRRHAAESPPLVGTRGAKVTSLCAVTVKDHQMVLKTCVSKIIKEISSLTWKKVFYINTKKIWRWCSTIESKLFRKFEAKSSSSDFCSGSPIRLLEPSVRLQTQLRCPWKAYTKFIGLFSETFLRYTSCKLQSSNIYDNMMCVYIV